MHAPKHTHPLFPPLPYTHLPLLLQDIATLTGGQVVSEDLGMKLDKVDAGMLGGARKVYST